MNSEILVAILTSTFFAALVTGFINYIINSKKIMTENIVYERKKWRETIKSISHEINIAENSYDLNIAISKLKVNINAYGQSNNSNVMLDGHLWKLIKRFEGDKTRENKIDIYAKNFTDMISVLVKYDWERTKIEIKGSSNIKGIMISNAICVFFGIFSNIYFFMKNDIEITNSLIIELMLITIIVAVFCVCIYYAVCKSTQYIFEVWKTEKRTNLKVAYMLLVGFILFAMYDNAVNSEYVIIDFFGEKFITTGKIQVVGMLLGGFISLIHIRELYKNRMDYCELVNKVMYRINVELKDDD